MAAWVPRRGRNRVEPDPARWKPRTPARMAPFAAPAATLSPIRDALHALMWDKAGILRDAAGLAEAALRPGRAGGRARCNRRGRGGRGFNLAWQDWLNLKSLMLTSRAIVAAAEAREESRGAHWREDFPQTRDDCGGPVPPPSSPSMRRAAIAVGWQPVAFTRVRPGESLLAAAE